MTRTAIALGSNVGDPVLHVTTAIEELAALGEVVARSSLYTTAPIGKTDQADFVNAVVVVETALEPRDLLDALLGIEATHGRHRGERWGPRTLDLDLIVYEGRELSEPGLTVPHPEAVRRRFVLEPLAEIWPDAPLTGGVSAAGALAHTMDQSVERRESVERGESGERRDATEPEEPQVAGWQVFVVTMTLALLIWWSIDALL